MIEKLQIRNFQCHEALDIDFDPVLTCITGHSDSGKTAILRALTWVMTNYPEGVVFIRRGSSCARVRLTVDGSTITRKRSKTSNNYFLGRKKYSALGRGKVPPDISKLLNLQDLSLQRQHDQPLYLLDSPGEVSRQLNRVVNLSLIDAVLANLASELRKAKTESEVCHSRLAKSELHFNNLNWVEQANSELSIIQGLHDTIEQTRARIAQVQRLRQHEVRVTSDQVFASRAILCGEKVLSIAKKRQEVQDRVGRLVTLCTRIRQLDGLGQLRTAISKGEQILTLHDQVEEVQGKVWRAEEFRRQIKEQERSRCEATKQVEKLRKELLEVGGGECPTCGQGLSN